MAQTMTTTTRIYKWDDPLQVYSQFTINGGSREHAKKEEDSRDFPAYLLIVTRVPIGTRRESSNTSSLNMRMQPCETDFPIDDGSLVP